MRTFIRRKPPVIGLLIGIAALNLVAYRQARAFTHFAPAFSRLEKTEPEGVAAGAARRARDHRADSGH